LTRAAHCGKQPLRLNCGIEAEAQVAVQIGDTVILNSGGEVMTVEGVSDDLVQCVWFNGKKVERSSFDPRTIKPFQDTFAGF
jgi:uncharacterized protein YodC (DUF2158 family)